MGCELISMPGAVFALWGRPTITDIDRVKAELDTAAASCGHPVVYVARIPVDAPPPDARARARIDELMPSVLQVCSTYHVVLEGEGFGAAIKRGILTGIFQLSWRRKTFFVHATAGDVLRSVAPDCKSAVSALLTAAKARGLLTSSLRAA